MSLSLGHLLLVLIIIFVLFGAGRLPKVMGDLGKGVRNLREGLNAQEPTITSTTIPPVVTPVPPQEVLPPEEKNKM